MKDKKTALYIRVSTDAQAEEGYSVEAQTEKLIKFCDIHDYKYHELYTDGGWSGSNLDRPEIKRLISDIETGYISRVIVFKLDRISRSQKDMLFLLEDIFIPNGVDFISLNENLDTSTPYGKAMIGILAAFAQLERENIRERTQMGMRERIKQGFWRGGGNPPFGYDYDPQRNILIPNEHAEDVRKIYDLYLQGYSTTQLANMFDVSGDKQITNILDRVTYLGKIPYNGGLIEGCHEAIIDEETFERVKAERRIRSTKNAVTSSYLLTGLIYCGKCGSKMRYQKWGKDTVKMVCYSQQPSKPNLVRDINCKNLKYNADEIEAAVLNDLFQKTKDIKAGKGLLGKRASALDELRRKYDELSVKIKRLYNLYASSGDELLLETIEENKEELNRISGLIENEKKTNSVIKEISERQQTISNIESAWPAMTLSEKQRALRICINRIVLDNENIRIEYAFD
ncbi:site-specific DNA recombinase [Ruminococcaceae bacterium FB2012]|nr:site-specific DNA recombinase [Ruminococcaceae bacterium FB2012]